VRFHRSTGRVVLATAALVLSGLVGLSSPAGAVAAAPCTVPKDVAPARPLDTRPVTANDRAIVAAAANRYASRRTTEAAPVVVNVRAHVLKSTNPSRPYATPEQIAAQIDVLNHAYAGDQDTDSPTKTNFSFRLYSTDVTTRTAWYWAEYGSRSEWDMKRALRQGHAWALNLYFINQVRSNQTLGWATFPQDRARRPRQDGVVINVNSMPQGDYTDFNLGDTATHEIGHWLGLYHTFQGGCTAPGDEVTDTPREREPTSGCPEDGTKNTCPSGEADPIHNFMDYAVDDCMWEFTPGQSARMDMMWSTYRAP
jgi:hypothetical protein